MDADAAIVSRFPLPAFVIWAAGLLLFTALCYGAAFYLLSVRGVVPGVEGCRFLGSVERQRDCVADRSLVLIEQEGLVPALAQLDREANASAFLGGACHIAMHDVANSHFRPGSSDGFAAVRGSGGQCADGYVHGFLQMAAEEGSADDRRELVGRCMGLDVPIERRSCIHGLGHGLRRGSSLAGSVAGCTDLASGREARYGCLAGAFMEDDWLPKAQAAPRKDFDAACRPEFGRDAVLVCRGFATVRGANTGVSNDAMLARCESYGPADGGLLCADLAGGGFGGNGFEICAVFTKDAYRLSCLNGLARDRVFDGRPMSEQQYGRECVAQSAATRWLCAQALGRAALESEISAGRAASIGPVKDACDRAFTTAAERKVCVDRSHVDTRGGLPSLSRM